MKISATRWGQLTALGLVLISAAITSRVYDRWTPPPVLAIEMSSTASSNAQVYYDIGQGFQEFDSRVAPVFANQAFSEVRLPLPRKPIRTIRFDPLTVPGTVEIRRVRILEADGSTVSKIPLSRVVSLVEIRQRTELPGSIRFETVDGAKDPSLLLKLDKPITPTRFFFAAKTIAALTVLNLAFLLPALLLAVPALRTKSASIIRALDAAFASFGLKVSSPRFLTFDHLAIWFYASCALLFVLTVAADLNGSSVDFNSRNLHQYGPETVVAGTAKAIRSDEWNLVTPDMFYQVYRQDPFESTDSPFGNFHAALLANVPVKHITTLCRPQYWGFFFLPPDYGFSYFWQMKWLLMVTGTFTLLLVLTGSSLLSAGGALWLFFSSNTQWDYSWPSMLPEMCGMFCFILVFAMYLTVGRNRWALGVSAILLAICCVNFAMFAYVPHLLPYFWTGIFLFAGWLYARKREIIEPEGRGGRLIAIVAAGIVAGLFLSTFKKDVSIAIAGIGATAYPGHRSLNGGSRPLTVFLSHYFGAFETMDHFPQALGNICEAAGFLWLAPVTLCCWGALKQLPKERKVLFAALWPPTVILACWDLLPVPAKVGHLLFLDLIDGQRTLPALGLLNTAIVMMALAHAPMRRKLSLQAKSVIAVPAVFLPLAAANSALNNYFSPSEVVVSASWLVLVTALLCDGRKRSFIAAAVLPSVYFFGLVNPICRGMGAITSAPLFQFVQSHPKLKRDKWLVMAAENWFGVFSAAGLNNYDGVHYLPRIEDFPIFRAHGFDVERLNAGGSFTARPLETGKRGKVVSLVDNTVELDVSPLDPLLKDLHIRYVAFDYDAPANIVGGLKPVSTGPVSGFWLYEIP